LALFCTSEEERAFGSTKGYGSGKFIPCLYLVTDIER